MRVGDRVVLRGGTYAGERGVIEEHFPGDSYKEFDVALDCLQGGRFGRNADELVLEKPPSAAVSGTKPTNPKDAIGSDKLPLHLWPETATLTGSLAFLEGALKYGRNNWRDAGVRATIYIDAVKRHINAWAEGEDVAPDSEIPHLGHALACLAILVDAQAAGKLLDDRQYPGGYLELVAELTPHVPRLKAKYADKNPRHWTIADAGGEHAQT